MSERKIQVWLRSDQRETLVDCLVYLIARTDDDTYGDLNKLCARIASKRLKEILSLFQPPKQLEKPAAQPRVAI